MSAYTLSRGSIAALGILTRHAGTEALLLAEPARELCAEITVEPIGTADQRGQLEAVLHLREQRHSITLQRDDSANPQHLAEWVEAIANGTLDTAQAAPQRAAPPVLLRCCKCGGAAVGYDYAIPGHEFRHGVKCPRSCMETEGYESSTQAHESWNAWQLEKLAEATDMVNHPPHYNSHPSGVECIEVTERLPFNLGNAFKYVFRHRQKNGAEDLQKARWYLLRELERSSRQGIALGDICIAGTLARRIAAHEAWLLGDCLVAIASDAVEPALDSLDQLLAAA